MIDFIEKDDALIFSVRVIPRSSKSEIVGEFDNALKVKLNSPPVDGAANTELIKLLAKEFDVSKNQVEILSGTTSKSKQVKISGVKKNALPEIFSRQGK
jgi:uncharacterized protein (TIGR00251 family)